MKLKKLFAAAAFAVASFAGFDSSACSLVSYQGDSSLVIVGRSLDWKTPIPTNLFVYPRGMKKVGNTTPDAVKWTSKYGAVYAVSYDGGVTEGMNEKGLAVNGLFCKGTVYVNPETTGRPAMSLAVFVAWILDNFATTQEACDALAKQDFTISGATFDGGTVSTLHWAINDAQGNSAVFEFDHGNIRIYNNDSVRVFTNDPPFPQMLAINNYWKGVGGVNMLPGTVKSPDRFVRASFFEQNVEKTADANLGIAITRSIIMNVSVPYHYTVNGEPNVSSTQWRSFSNLRDKYYYFEPVTHLGVIYVDLNKCNLHKGAPVLKLTVENAKNSVGCANNLLVPTAPFTPMY